MVQSRMHIYLCISGNEWLCNYMCVCMYVCIYAYACLRMYICVCMDVHVFILEQKCKKESLCGTSKRRTLDLGNAVRTEIQNSRRFVAIKPLESPFCHNLHWVSIWVTITGKQIINVPVGITMQASLLGQTGEKRNRSSGTHRRNNTAGVL